jgi:hypothetical protein
MMAWAIQYDIEWLGFYKLPTSEVPTTILQQHNIPSTILLPNRLTYGTTREYYQVPLQSGTLLHIQAANTNAVLLRISSFPARV